MRALAALALTFGLATPSLVLAAAADKAEGKEIPHTATVGGQELKLNGWGIRKKFVVKVYVGALYLAAPTHSAEEVVKQDAPKAVRMTFLRGVSKGQIMDAFREGFEANTGRDAPATFAAKLDRIATAIPEEIKEGQVLEVAYVPGTGTIVSSGGNKVSVEGKDFSDALFMNWFGPKPPNDDLKRRMLGR
ncbi:MAG TPA: chalcone isomerase family protein [Anaeromyxobacteraceae bacterium]|nr:chalcone isomerase family protein [Anaeromyxobacteraceae bacterium]